jgi:hypothetical protein
MVEIDPGYYIIKKEGEPDKWVDQNGLKDWLDEQNRLGNTEVNNPNNTTPGKHDFNNGSSYESN